MGKRNRILSIGLLLAAALLSPRQARACDGCALFASVTPDASRNQAGLFFRYRAFSGLNYAPDGGSNKTQHYPGSGAGHGFDPEEAGNPVETFATTRAFCRYFLTTRLYAQIELPLVANAYRDAQHQKNLAGLGDITLTAGYEIANSAKGDRAFQMFASAGIKLPTGRRFQNQADKRDWFDLQGSTESLDFLTGLQATWRKNKFGWQANALYRINTTSPGAMRFGNFLNLRAQAISLLPIKGGKLQLMPFAGGMLENYSGRYFLGNRIYGTGGSTALAVAGLSLFTQRLAIQPEVQLPIYQDLNDLQLLGRTAATLQVSVMF